MAWFCNHYQCARCQGAWTDEWSSVCEDECPYCEARHMTPFRSDDLSVVIEPRTSGFGVLRSPPSAADDPEYEELAAFPTLTEAERFILDSQRR